MQLKYYIMTLCLCVGIQLHAQDTPCTMPHNEMGKYEYIEVIHAADSSTNSLDLYNAALISLAELFVDSEQVIEEKNEDSRTIIGNFVIRNPRRGMSKMKHTFKFRLRIDFKEGRYRVKINYSEHTATHTHTYTRCSCMNDLTAPKCGGSLCATKGQWDKERCLAAAKVPAVVLSLRKYIQQNLDEKSSPNSSDDW